MNNSKIYFATLLFLLLGFIAFPTKSFAHPGNTASDGCHYCRTNCDKWGVPWNERHCHNSYTPPPPTYTEPIIPDLPSFIETEPDEPIPESEDLTEIVEEIIELLREEEPVTKPLPAIQEESIETIEDPLIEYENTQSNLIKEIPIAPEIPEEVNLDTPIHSNDIKPYTTKPKTEPNPITSTNTPPPQEDNPLNAVDYTALATLIGGGITWLISRK